MIRTRHNCYHLYFKSENIPLGNTENLFVKYLPLPSSTTDHCQKFITKFGNSSAIKMAQEITFVSSLSLIHV